VAAGAVVPAVVATVVVAAVVATVGAVVVAAVVVTGLRLGLTAVVVTGLGLGLAAVVVTGLGLSLTATVVTGLRLTVVSLVPGDVVDAVAPVVVPAVVVARLRLSSPVIDADVAHVASGMVIRGGDGGPGAKRRGRDECAGGRENGDALHGQLLE
jgi:hypothetical protein